MKLYELSAEWRDLLTRIADEEGELSEEHEHAIDLLGGELQDKVRSTVCVLRELEHEAACFEQEAKRLADRARARANRARWLKDYVQRCMQLAGEKKVETGLHTVSIQLNPPAVAIADEAVIPPDYRTEKVVTSIDKKAILAALKDGIDVPGATLTRSEGVRIR